MADEFDEELDRGPEGSIITPIFMGCGAMGLGCLFSLAAVAIGFMVLFPGIGGLIGQLTNNPMREPAVAMAEANQEVIDAIGVPIVAELDDLDEGPNTDGINIELGDSVELTATYDITGPNGEGRMHVVGSRTLSVDDEWDLSSVIVTLAGGEQIRVHPSSIETPPPPAQLAPPETPALEVDEIEGEPEVGADADDVVPDEASTEDGEEATETAEPEPVD